jgi:uncharacterized protein YybS (DUF2232 family)
MIALSRNMGPLTMVLDYFQRNLNETIRAYEALGLDQKNVAELQRYGTLFLSIIRDIAPALLIIGTGLMVWINVIVSRPLFRLGNLEYPDFGPTDQWQAPEFMVWGVIASGFALLLFKGVVRTLAVNSLMVLLAIYVFHGVAIVLFLLNKYRVSPWIRFAVYFLIIFQQFFVIGLALAGLFDQWIDFRRVSRRKAG